MTIKTTVQSYLTSPMGRVLAWIIIVLALLLVLKNIADIWSLFRKPVIAPPAKETIEEKPTPVAEDIVKWHLLGESPRAVDTARLPKSLLNITLVGIFSATPASDAMVAIELPGGKEKIYRAGDSLPDGVIIYKILSDRVILKRNDQFEVLVMPEEKLIFEPATIPLDFEKYRE